MWRKILMKSPKSDLLWLHTPLYPGSLVAQKAELQGWGSAANPE